MTDLWYDETGAGPPVVLLHQGVVDSRIWASVVPLIAERHRVIRYDQRGFGRSPMPDGPYSVVADLLGVLDATSVESAVLVGASRGGNIALATALDHPSRASHLVLVGSGLPGHSWTVDWTPDQIMRWETAEAAGDYEAMAELDMEAWAPLGADDALRAMFVENAVGSNAEDPAVDGPVAHRLADVTVPTLVITPARDVPPIVEIAERLAREIPGSRRAVIEQADHMVPWRAPEELAHLVLEFLS